MGFPDVYLRLTLLVGTNEFKCFWYKLDLDREKPISLNWQIEYLDDSEAAVLKSEIYVLGGYRLNPEPNRQLTSVPSGDVFRINTAATPNPPSRFESAPPRLGKANTSCTVLGNKIISFNEQCNVEIFDRSLDRWLGFSSEEVGLPCKLEWDSLSVPDLENNRVLMNFAQKGMYAFYPETFKWEFLVDHRHLFYNGLCRIATNNVLYCLTKNYATQGYELAALDMADGFRPMKIVWPSEFDHQFFCKLWCLEIIYLGDGKLCLVSLFHEHLDVPPDYDSDEYYTSFEEEEEEKEEDESLDNGFKKKYMPVITCVIFEVEKQVPPPQPNNGRLRRKTKLLVKTTSRLVFKLEDLVYTRCGNLVNLVDTLVVPK